MDQQKEVLFTVGGMHCAACSSRLERVLNGMDGVQSATVSLAANSAPSCLIPRFPNQTPSPRSSD